jgi:radical SAM superfamily enzyme YgiQ (UPF0313 family)
MRVGDGLAFEQGPIRPPSEAGSLLIRATRNCPWNRCAFCGTYKGRKFSRRPMDEIKQDIDTAKAITEAIGEISREYGDEGRLTRRVLSGIFSDSALSDSFRSVALWMASGGNTVFLQDANSIMLPTDSLVEILNHITKSFPQVERVTSYARAVTLKGKTVDEYVRLKEAGLARLHVGMESGSDKVLKMIDKGARSDQVIEGGRRAVEGGISLCFYIIPGIGGTQYSEENAMESARVVNAVNPSHVRFRSLYIKRGTRLDEMARSGEFVAPDEDSIVREIRLFISELNGVSLKLVSDHILNLLEEIEGELPDDRRKILDLIDSYLNLPEEDRLLFQLGRRGGALRYLDDLKDLTVLGRLREAKKQIEKDMPGGVPEYIQAIKKQFV